MEELGEGRQEDALYPFTHSAGQPYVPRMQYQATENSRLCKGGSCMSIQELSQAKKQRAREGGA